MKSHLLLIDSAKIPEPEGASRHAAFKVLVLIKGVWRGVESKILFLLPQGFESFPSDLPRARRYDLVLVEVIKTMVVDFGSIES